MLRNFLPRLLIIIISVLFLLSLACKKGDEKEDTSVIKVTTYLIIIKNITSTSAICGGNVTGDGGAPIIARGVCWSTTSNPSVSDSKTSDGTGTGIFTSNITGLTPNTNYTVKAYATNNMGTGYGNEVQFTTKKVLLPSLITTDITSVTPTSAKSGGNISVDGGGSITERGVCWSTTINPTTSDTRTSDGTGRGSFSSNIAGLTPNTVYYVRAYAINSAGTAYGNQFILKTMTDQISDIEGNIYYTVTIGNQIWMGSNLKTTKYRDGTNIPNYTDNSGWGNITYGAYCDYNNIPYYSAIYGRLYNWMALVDEHKICPIEWHIPTDAEWTTLENYLISNAYNYNETTSGNKIAKALAANANWLSSTIVGAVGNTDYLEKRNITGFNALPGGYRYFNGSFKSPGDCSYWWSATSLDSNFAWQRSLFYNHRNLCTGINNKHFGFSVRCVKD